MSVVGLYNLGLLSAKLSTLSRLFRKSPIYMRKRKCLHFSFSLRLYSESTMIQKDTLLRNIGIIAHIDAGKTTTTERMLYYSGFTNLLGEVHDGTTIMDYMEQERERGITITSAAISFPWKNHTFNLIDTPGHVDFTIEVERSLRVIDGSVAVFDSSAGVEAQSFTVWLQADRYNLPRICFLNKMDKESSNLDMCLEQIKNKLYVKPLLLHNPVGHGNSFRGIVDLVTMNIMDWTQSKSSGRVFDSRLLTSETNEELWVRSLEMRSQLVEELTDLDNEIAEAVLEHESTDLVSPLVLRDAIRRVTLNRSAVPVFVGSAYKNIGVQPLMDAVVTYLPSPKDRVFPGVDLYSPSLCAVAFKIIHHKRMGIMTFIRVYSGTIDQGSRVYNATRKQYEKISKLYQPYADDFKEVSQATEGSILVATGLKNTVTGDTLVFSAEAFAKAENILQKSDKNQNGEKQHENLLMVGVPIPEPVFMCSVEAPSLSQQKLLDHALKCLEKEDPSLRVTVQEESGQTILAGMGELHLSIIKDRIKKEYKVDADLGPLTVSYRESIKSFEKNSFTLNKMVGDTKQDVQVTLSLEPCEGYEISKIEFAYSKENHEILQNIRKPKLDALKRGISAALLAGPVLQFPVIDVKPKLHWLQVGRGTADTFVAAAASRCIQQILRNAETMLLEPVMRLDIVVPVHKYSNVLADITRRRAQIASVEDRQELKIIVAFCPLAELVGFTSSIRSLSSGLANLSMEFTHYRQMTQEESAATVSSFSGFS